MKAGPSSARSTSRGAPTTSPLERPEWKRVLEAIRAREFGGTPFDALLTWQASRAQRDLQAYTILQGACVGSGVSWGYNGTLYDLSDREDAFRTGLDALMAADEARRISTDVKRVVKANAMAGKPHGKTLYGYRHLYHQETREPWRGCGPTLLANALRARSIQGSAAADPQAAAA